MRATTSFFLRDGRGSWPGVFVQLAFGLAVVSTYSGCSDDEVLKEPTSDKNFDDPDEPATPGTVGAVDAATADVMVACTTNEECPPRAPACFFAVTDGCQARGVCLDFAPPTGCAKARFCACGGGGVTACAPAGYSPIPVAPGAICPEALDAGQDAPADAAAD